MAKTKTPSARKNEKLSVKEEKTFLEEAQEHHFDSDKYVGTLRPGWGEKEKMLIVQLDDTASENTSSKVYDPRLSTIVFERGARVMARRPSGKFFAKSDDDLGKNIRMNLLIDHYMKTANEQWPFLIKNRMIDIYSQVYGTFFALAPWRVNLQTGYIGPELNLIAMRDAFPQPGVPNVDMMNWFQVRHYATIDWLLKQDGQYWNKKEIERLRDDLKAKKSKGDNEKLTSENMRSEVERTYFPGGGGDKAFPTVELLTEYRINKWLTYTPQRTDEKKDRPYLLRVVGNEDKPPYPGGLLPVMGKHCFPLLDSPIGLGEFERGKTLQYAINSLINLYLDGVKYSIFPPLAINIDNVVAESIEWGAGNKWFMDRPNVDVAPVNLSPLGLQTFQSTYNFLLSALMNQAGTSEITSQGQTQPTMGKTPEAVKFLAQRENARDEWDRVMMEEFIKQYMHRWAAMLSDPDNQKLVKPVSVRLFGSEIRRLKQRYPDIDDLSEKVPGFTMGNSGEAATLDIKPKDVGGVLYDYEIETGSTQLPDLEIERNNLATFYNLIKDKEVRAELQKKNKDVDFIEAVERIGESIGIKDVNKLIVDIAPPAPAGPPQPQPVMNMGVAAPGMPPGGQPPMQPPPQPMQPPMEEQFTDPEIAAAAAQARELLGGDSGIPAQ